MNTLYVPLEELNKVIRSMPTHWIENQGPMYDEGDQDVKRNSHSLNDIKYMQEYIHLCLECGKFHKDSEECDLITFL